LDAVGNIASEGVSGTLALAEPLPESATLTYSKLNQVTKRNTASYSYDADGNLTAISGGLLAATYTPENRLTQLTRLISGTNQIVTNLYDGNGLRVKRTVTGGAVTQFHYGPGDKLLFTTDGAGALLACYIWNGASVAAITVGNSLDTDLRYPLQNHLGSTVAVINPAGTADTQYAYQPYGAYFKQTNAGSADPGLLTFIGGLGVQDEGNGLFLMKQRFYDANTGHFLQRDPTGLTGGINLYAYANGNPFSYIDPYGTDSWSSWAWWGASKTVQATATGVTYVWVAGGAVASAPAVGVAAAVWAGYEALEWGYGKLRDISNKNRDILQNTLQQENGGTAPNPPPAPGSDAESDQEEARRDRVASQTAELGKNTENAIDVHN
jgi:RHS repeat-associated protein